MRKVISRGAVLTLVAGFLSVLPALVAPAQAATKPSGTIKLVSPGSQPVLLGTQIQLKGRFKHGAHRAFVIQKRALSSAKWRPIKSTRGKTNARGVFTATFTPPHTYTYRAALLKTATKPLRVSKIVTVGLTATWSAVSAGAAHTCAIRATDSTLWCWGDNVHGDVGDGSTAPALVPVKVSSDAWNRVSAGNGYTCGIKSDKSLWCWGDNTDDVLGLGPSAAPYYTTPQEVDASSWYWISSGDHHTCAMKQVNAPLYCWGDNTYGELGLQSTGGTANVPTLVDDSGVNSGASQIWLQVSVGTDYTCGIRDDLSLWCWGANASGELGINQPADSTVYDYPQSLGTTFFAVSSSRYLANDTADAGSPDSYSTGGGGGFTCAIKNDWKRYCWGDNSFGQFGNGTTSTTVTTSPVAVTAYDNTQAGLALGGGQACGIFGSPQAVQCWGYNAFGQVGDGTTTSPVASQYSTTPDSLSYTLSYYSLPPVSAGADHTCAIRADQTLWCWGLGTSGQLGNGSELSLTAPFAVDAG